jgi:hypothetical protein
MRTISIYREDYKSDYAYRKAIREYRNMGWYIARVCGGVKCFESVCDYELWRNQK